MNKQKVGIKKHLTFHEEDIEAANLLCQKLGLSFTALMRTLLRERVVKEQLRCWEPVSAEMSTDEKLTEILRILQEQSSS